MPAATVSDRMLKINRQLVYMGSIGIEEMIRSVISVGHNHSSPALLGRVKHP